MAMATVVWGINVAFLVQGAARLRSVLEPAPVGCVVVNARSSLPTLVSVAVTDIILLLTMLLGLLRIRSHCDGTFGLAHLLWKQV